MKTISISIIIGGNIQINNKKYEWKLGIYKNKKDALRRPFFVVLSYSERAVLCNDSCNNTRTYSTTTFTDC
ncbi:TPA: hypothetical protein ACS730_003783, partial [Providencia alcalifaciens]